MATYNITLKAWSDNAALEPVTIYQNDILSRTINITLMDNNGPPIDLTDSAVRCYFVKSDKKIVYQEADIISETNGKISVTCESQVTAVPGPVVAMVQAIYNNGSTLNIGPLRLIVAANNLDNAIISTNEFTALTEALSTVQQYDNKIATNTADIAELQADKANKTEVIPLSQKGTPGGVATLDGNGNLVQGLPVQVHYPTLQNGFIAYNNNPNYMPKITKQGNIVNIWALLSPPPGNNIGSNDTTMFDIPRDLAPPYHVITLTQGGQLDDVYRVWVRGLTDPKPMISVLNTKPTNPSAGSWIPINITYII